MGIVKNDKVMMIRDGGQILHFLSYILLKMISGLRISAGYFCDSRTSKMTSKLP